MIASHFGGTRAPMVVSWPGRIRARGEIRDQFTHVVDVAPTLYEVARIVPPSEVNGIRQISMDGISFAYSFYDGAAPSRRQTQVFEQLGNRAIYSDGWIAAARHTLPWVHGAHATGEYEKDRWELYNIDEDFSQADDLASEFPQRLQRLKELFDIEARRNDIYPLTFSWAKWPSENSAPERSFTYYAGQRPIQIGPAVAKLVPNLDRSHAVTIVADVQEQGGEGVLFSYGNSSAGFALYMEARRLVYQCASECRICKNTASSASLPKNLIVSEAVLPPGRLKIVYRYSKSMRTTLDSQSCSADADSLHLYINGQLVAETKIVGFHPGWWGTMTIGRVGTFQIERPSTDASPLEFTGSIERVHIDLD